MGEERERRALGRRIAELREQAGLTQAQLAERAGISLNAVQNYEQGQRVPSALVVVPIARAVSVSADLLLDLSGELGREPTPGRRGRPRQIRNEAGAVSVAAAEATEQTEAKPRRGRRRDAR